MHLDLSELLACPHCGPGRSMVVSVDRIESRRVLRGRLACPECEARYAIEGGRVDFGQVIPARDETAPGGAAGPEAATRVAALLDLREGGGVVLLGLGLEEAAARVSGLAPEVEVIALSRDPAGKTPERVTLFLGIREVTLPLRSGGLRGAALLEGSAGAVAEAARVVRPGGRLAVLRPQVDASALQGLPLRVLAAAESALVAERTDG